MKFIKLLSQITLVLIILLIISIIVLATTQMGLRLMVKTFEYVSPGVISAQSISGRLIGPITINKLRYHQAGKTVVIGHLKLDWQVSKLFEKTLVIDNLTVKNIDIKITANNKENSTAQFTLPFKIEVNKATFTNITVDYQKNETPIHIKSLAMQNIKLGKTLAGSVKLQLVKPFAMDSKLTLSGEINNYQLTLLANNKYLHWRVLAKGNTHSIKLDIKQGTTLSGKLTGNLSLNWLEQLKWSSHLIVDKLAMNQIIPAAPKLLSFDFNGQGIGENSTIVVKNISALVQDKIITGNIKAAIADNKIHQIDTKLHSGKAHVEIKGELAKQINLTWHITVPELSNFLPDAQGVIGSQGNVTGTLAKPVISAKLKLSEFHFKDYALQSMDAAIELNKQQKIKLDLVGKGLSIKQFLIPSTTVKVTGDLNYSTIVSTIHLEKSTIGLTLSGAWLKNHWQGELDQLTISNFDKWTLESKVPVIVNQQAFKIGFACLHHQSEKLCFAADWKKQQSFKAQLKTEQFSLQNLSSWFKLPVTLDGVLQSNLTADFASGEMSLQGSAKVRNGQFIIPQVKLNLTKITADITADGKQVKYVVHGLAGDGKITATGTTQLNPSNWQSELKITGQNIDFNYGNHVKVTIAPDLKLNLDGKHIDIMGSLTIPKATIAPPNYQQTITLPPDVVYEKQQDEAINSPYKLTTDIKLILGDDVNLAYAGLTGKLTGTLTIKTDENNLTLANGQLHLIDASYKAYGQDLTIEQGIIGYTNGPIDNPNLDIIASKVLLIRQDQSQFGQVQQFTGKLTIGIILAGELRHPKISLFSKPITLSQSDILSYLLFGEPISTVSNDKSLLLVKAALALSASGDSSIVTDITNQIKQTFGLSELGLQSSQEVSGDDIIDNTSLVLGKYLSPRLYVDYSIGLIEPINTFRARYSLTKHISLQSESNSLGSGADVIFNFNSDK